MQLPQRDLVTLCRLFLSLRTCSARTSSLAEPRLLGDWLREARLERSETLARTDVFAYVTGAFFPPVLYAHMLSRSVGGNPPFEILATPLILAMFILLQSCTPNIASSTSYNKLFILIVSTIKKSMLERILS